MKRLFSVILLSLFFISKAQQSCYDKANEYRYGKFNFDSIFERIRQSQKMVIGCQLPNDSFTTIQGVKKHIANYWGKPLVINFWYLHCPPCINEIPSFAELDKKYGNKISLIAISQDPKLQVLDFLTKHNFKAEIAADELSFIDKYNLGSGYPFTLIINQEGKIVHIISGGREEIDNQLDLYKEVSPYIDKMLANSEEDEIIPIREVEIDSKPEIIDVCEQMPEYKGGWKELNKFIKSNNNINSKFCFVKF